ncbi:MAG: DUF6765 family protein [Spirochaetota bacterium]
MNIEFHYFGIYYLCRQAGLDDCFSGLLAASSQYVDASTYPLAFSTPREQLSMTVTQNYVFWDEAVRRDIYLPFHFIPGGMPGGIDGHPHDKANPYTVRPNGDIAKDLMIQAFKEKDPYLMGIALHSFADTWAHQNFSGLVEEGNSITSDGSMLRLPPAGHLQALTQPDEPDRIWFDPRLPKHERRISNAQRFTQAGRKIYRYLCIYNNKSFSDEELVLDSMQSIWSGTSREGRLADYTIRWDIAPWDARDWQLEAGANPKSSLFSDIKNYDKLAWAKSELLKSIGEKPPVYLVDSGFYSSKLYHWHEAAMEHRKRALHAMSKRGL